jgi:hypothetical protein
MDEFKLQSTLNTYNNALLLRRYLVSDYMKLKMTTIELINSIRTCEILIITNYFILQQHGMDKSR